MILRALLCVCLCVACGEPEPLRVGTSGDYAPFSKDGRGFDVEVAERLAADLGMRIEWVRFRWPELAARVEAGDFDVAMSGVTWRPERAVRGFMSRAVAQGGPCWIGARDPVRPAVNRGGILERFARARFPDARLRAVDDNGSLPALLASGEADAIVTDSFEVAHFARPGQAVHCEPRRDRKVYWVVPARVDALGPRIDAWIARNEPWLRERRAGWFGDPQPRDDVDHLLDLTARRLALMPAVARDKRARGLAIEDPQRERVVLAAADRRAREAGLDPEALRASFALQIELAKRVQRATPDGPASLDLERELRPVLLRLGERLVAAYAAVAPLSPGDLPDARLEAWFPELDPAARAELAQALVLACQRAP